MPTYAKFLKEILSNKRRLEEYATVALTEESSAILQNKLPPKLQDPGSFSIPCQIGTTTIGKALCDLGASVSLLPLSICQKLDIGELKPTTISLQLADRSIKFPIGILENVPLKVGSLFIPVDFVVLEMEEDTNIPIILGRPFLATAGAIIDGTKDYMLTYRRADTLDIVGFSDADYAGCVDDKKSTSGYIFMMAGGAVSWKSVKQTLTASSTMEAEYMACYEAASLSIVDSISSPLKLYCDNSATVAFSKNTRSTSRSKHIDIKYYFVKEKVAESLITVEYTPTASMLADPLTKGLPICVFAEHISRMGLLGA
ncbi:hypothetical protein K2173_024587 [Erythroxylum novogranatense]|uniref:Retrovirus-related Pol polyprotein from transposon TNT 1-94 n=1 Tax=Erythroxylum novogranatense TaxID=1862640 RepID=A0AAV8SUT0_9ROSI|nr:hypothetical protein K2173_024587 [Erythroxylum novogranatense]